MKKTVSILSLSCLISASAFAVDFTGHWTGTGQMTQKQTFGGGAPTSSPCSKVDVTVEHIPEKSVNVKRYHAICGQMDSDWGPYTFEIRGEKIFVDGEETGTLTGDTMKCLQASGGVQYAFNLRLKTPPTNQPPVLETYYGVHNMMGTIVIEGSLKQEP